jgi:hypothetical protein
MANALARLSGARSLVIDGELLACDDKGWRAEATNESQVRKSMALALRAWKSAS